MGAAVDDVLFISMSELNKQTSEIPNQSPLYLVDRNAQGAGEVETLTARPHTSKARRESCVDIC
jgi:hypothetical protein